MQRDDVVSYKGEFWRVTGCFTKYYNRWALVDEPVALKKTHRLELQCLRIDPQDKPYVQLKYYRNPWFVAASAEQCTSAGYTLLDQSEHSKAKRFKTGVDLWA